MITGCCQYKVGCNISISVSSVSLCLIFLTNFSRTQVDYCQTGNNHRNGKYNESPTDGQARSQQQSGDGRSENRPDTPCADSPTDTGSADFGRIKSRSDDVETGKGSLHEIHQYKNQYQDNRDGSLYESIRHDNAGSDEEVNIYHFSQPDAVRDIPEYQGSHECA